MSTSAVLAIIATLDTLLAFRAAQDVADLPVSPMRDLVAQGIGNCAAGFAGGVAGRGFPELEHGCLSCRRQNAAGADIVRLLLGTATVLTPQVLAAIPSVVLAGILLATGILLFDRSVFRSLAETVG